MTSAGDNEASDPASKLWIAAIAAGSILAAALVSGLVSYLVSTQTVNMERLRLESENTIKSSEMFQKLIQQVKASDESAYALLALWKLYPDDKKLIVITALQHPTPATLTVLRAIGYDEELRQYSSTIESIMSNGTKDQRDAYSRLFLEVSPESVLTISMEATIKSQEQQYLAGPALEVVRYLQMKPALIPLLEQKVASDSRIHDNDRLQILFALILYAGNSRKAMSEILDGAAESVQNFSTLAPLLSSEAIKALSIADREKLFSIAVGHLEEVETDQLEEHYFNDVVDVIEMLRGLVQISPERDTQLASIYSSYYMLSAQRGSFSKLGLKRLSELDQEQAQKLFLSTLVCPKDENASEIFFATFDPGTLGLTDWAPVDRSQAISEAKKRMSEAGDSCEGW